MRYSTKDTTSMPTSILFLLIPETTALSEIYIYKKGSKDTDATKYITTRQNGLQNNCGPSYQCFIACVLAGNSKLVGEDSAMVLV